MDTTTRARPNHYEVLGLTPEASEQEIAQAFAREMSLFRARPVAAVAEISAAYETLRNPDRREVYDRSLGLRPDPEPERSEPEPLGWSFAVAQQQWRPFLASPVNAPWQVAPKAAPLPELHVAAEPEPEAPADPRIESIAASLRALAEPLASEPPASTELPREPVQAAGKVELKLDLRADDIKVAPQAAHEPRLRRTRWNDADRGSPWKRPGLTIGGLLLGVGIVGGVAGIAAGGDVQASVTVPVPAAKPVANADAPSAVLGGAEAQAGEPVRSRVARAPRTHPLSSPGLAEEELVSLSHAVASAPLETAEGTSDAAVAQAVPASLPLPSAVIARTIERIGYSCGSVASATPVEGRHAFKITCSSGQAYQAAPVGGRYRFRRWDRR